LPGGVQVGEVIDDQADGELVLAGVQGVLDGLVELATLFVLAGGATRLLGFCTRPAVRSSSPAAARLDSRRDL
jgi:hypothetical protein